MADIHQQIEAELPRLRRYARALVRDVVGADDLVQDCLTRALGKLHLWREGTDLRAWLFTILHNQYVNYVRRSVRNGPTMTFAGIDLLRNQPANQAAGLELRDLDRAIGQLIAEQREVILLIGLEGMSYGDASALLGVPIGTVRSRLSRGRLALRELMDVEPRRRDQQHPAKSRTPRREVAHLPARVEGSALPAIAG
jgi:RNA polymerase sigma-70 factor (ECF subfamily)